jgi:hypothetical protein
MSMLDPTMPALMRSHRARLLCALAAGVFALTCVAWSGAAQAQMPNVNLIPDIKSKSPEEIEQDKIADKAYKDSLRKIPDTKASSDPWGDVRSAETPKTAAKPKSRTGNAAH